MGRAAQGAGLGAGYQNQMGSVGNLATLAGAPVRSIQRHLSERQAFVAIEVGIENSSIEVGWAVVAAIGDLKMMQSNSAVAEYYIDFEPQFVVV
jgi:hypothetical protein